MSGGHIPTFHSVTEWETGRNVPCWAECPCGWSSEVVRDQTTAEWIHGQHMQQVGAIPTDDPFLAGGAA